MKKTHSCIQFLNFTILIIIFVEIISIASAENLDLSDSPLFLAHTVAPNMLIVLDNSSSTNYDILTKAHWDRAAYEYIYASGESYAPTDSDIKEGKYIKNSCIDPNDDCGVLRDDGTFTLSGPPDLFGHKYEGGRNFIPFSYLSSCSGFSAPCSIKFDDNTEPASCIGPAVFSLADCPETEALDWRVRSAASNVMYYNPDTEYQPWKFPKMLPASFTSARGNPYPGQLGYNRKVDLSSQAPLGIDPTSCISTPLVPCTLASFSYGFVYYIWVDDKGYGDPPNKDGCPQTKGRPHRGECINMTNSTNGMVDLWDTHYKVTVTLDPGTKVPSMKVEKISCDGTYDLNGALNCQHAKPTTELPAELIPHRKLLNKNSPVTADQEVQNIANWFQYYHRRLMTFKALISELPYISPSYRYALMSQGWDSSRLIVANDNDPTDPLATLGISKLDELLFEFPTGNLQEHNQNILNALFKLFYYDVTPLRETLDRAGKYYMFKDATGNPFIPRTTVDPITDKCQRNYSLVITDGYYNTLVAPAEIVAPIKDNDNDGSAVTLADVASYYYNIDLRDSSEFDNLLPPTSCDDPSHYPKQQHMVTFGISLGADGKLRDNNGDGWPDNIVNPQIQCPPDAGHTNVWNQTANPSWADRPMDCPGDCPEKIDDLWHAAYNSHGAYTFARNPEDLRDALRRMLDQINIARSVAAAASSSSYYNAGDRIFQTSFENQYWTGDLKGFTVDAAGNLITDSQSPWSAAVKLNDKDYTTRTILSYKPVQHQPIAFKWDQLDATTQQKALDIDPDDLAQTQSDKKGEARVQFLRGKGAGTVTGINRDDTFIKVNNFRIRTGLLGDIIQSDPVYVGQPFLRYDEYNCSECQKYSAFKSTSRDALVYVGANDGMLHGFNANDGQERIAYVPGSLIDRCVVDPNALPNVPNCLVYKLNSLTSRNYKHLYYVEGSPSVGDAYFNDSWHTVLVGSLRAGGQAVFALDITDPRNFNEATPSDTVLWEFSDNDDPDLGYTYSRPAIVRLDDGNGNGKWAAIFGNGYNNTVLDGDKDDSTKRNKQPVVSSNGEAVLYVYFLDNSITPRIIKLSTDTGKAADPTGLQRPNGLATPVVVDVDDNLTADYVYAGDLFGNLWKFDISNKDSSKWKVVKLFKAVDEYGNFQPITARPVVDIHPLGKGWGYMIYFGTGKYFENDDNVYEKDDKDKNKFATRQSFYGIWDNNVSADNPPPAFDRNSVTTTGNKSVLFKQNITLVDASSRKTSPASGTIRWLDQGKPYHKGWYMDFPLGEKQVSNPTMWNKRVIFTTLVLPETRQSCDYDGSSSWLMVVDANDGGTIPGITFIGSSPDIAGIKSTTLLPSPTPNVVPPPPPNSDNSDTSSSTPPYTLKLIPGKGGEYNPNPDDIGRQSWRQLWRTPK